MLVTFEDPMHGLKLNLDFHVVHTPINPLHTCYVEVYELFP